MPESPLAITLASATDEPTAVELEVSFVVEDEREPLDCLLFATDRAQSVIEPARASRGDTGTVGAATTGGDYAPGHRDVSSSDLQHGGSGTGGAGAAHSAGGISGGSSADRTGDGPEQSRAEDGSRGLLEVGSSRGSDAPERTGSSLDLGGGFGGGTPGHSAASGGSLDLGGGSGGGTPGHSVASGSSLEHSRGGSDSGAQGASEAGSLFESQRSGSNVRPNNVGLGGGGAGLLAVRQAAVALGARILGGAGAVHVLGGMPLRAVVGLGPRADITLETLRRAAAHAVGCATDLRRATLAIEMPSNLPPAITAAAAVEAIAEGALLAAHARTPRATLSPKPDALVPPGRCLIRLAASANSRDAPLSLGSAAHARAPTIPSPSAESPPASTGPPETVSPAAESVPPSAATVTPTVERGTAGDSCVTPTATGPATSGEAVTPPSPGISPVAASITSTPGNVTAGGGSVTPSVGGGVPSGEASTSANATVTPSAATVTSTAESVTAGTESVTPSAASVTSGAGGSVPRPGDDDGDDDDGGVGGAMPGAGQLDTALLRAKAHAAAAQLARELGDMPANRLSPVQLAEQAVAAVKSLDDVSTKILAADDLERLGAGLLLAVGSGSTRPPALCILSYNPPGATQHVAVVGKGITFDAGGINVKPAKGMGDMVHDKAGAAAAAAIAFGAAKLKLPIAVTALLACAENLPSGTAYRPGDVLQGLDGATVEIIDTDAEGRLVLADALTYALRLDEPRPPDVLVDLATLTGSIVSALGNEAAGLFGNDDRLAAQMLEAAERAGEPLWRMPILPGHRAQLKSERADRKQCAERWGDCAIAAAFLEMYVDKRPWLHLDIAGVAYNEGSPEWPAYHPKSGAAGTGVRTVLHFLEALATANHAAIVPP